MALLDRREKKFHRDSVKELQMEKKAFAKGLGETAEILKFD